MLFAKEKIQVRILAGIPFRPTVLPIRPAAIASELVKHMRRPGLA